jgi:hypothetical protein
MKKTLAEHWFKPATTTTDPKINKKCSMKFPKHENHTVHQRTPAEHSFKMKTTYLREHSSNCGSK